MSFCVIYRSPNGGRGCRRKPTRQNNKVDREWKGVNDLIGDGSNDSYSINDDDGQLLSWLLTWKASVRKIDDFRRRGRELMDR
mmetsp:Transcript_31307/g.53472  ORF Transcript_31307/g.53472 Transcript_31307/m.53472 type:complete len:83 (+) Transcript_31307:2771-3019(+)